MAIDAFVGKCVEALIKLAMEEVVMILGVREDIQRLQKKMEKIKDVLFDAERRRIDSLAIQSWLSELKDVLYDADDIIDLCRIKGRQMLAGVKLPSPVSCFPTVTSIPFRHETGKEIEKITSRLEEISMNMQQFKLDPSIPVVVPETRVNLGDTTSLPPPNVVGREVEHAMRSTACDDLCGDENPRPADTQGQAPR